MTTTPLMSPTAASAVLLGALSLPVLAQQAPTQQAPTQQAPTQQAPTQQAPACKVDQTGIQWVLPFEQAKARATADKRIMLVKPIAFGTTPDGGW